MQNRALALFPRVFFIKPAQNAISSKGLKNVSYFEVHKECFWKKNEREFDYYFFCYDNIFCIRIFVSHLY